MYNQCPLTGCYRGLDLVSIVSCTISHYPYRDAKRKVILTVRFDRLRPVDVLVPSVGGESGRGRSKCDDETMPVDSSRGGPVCWSLLLFLFLRLPAILRFVEGH